jgi:hypothetical protein
MTAMTALRKTYTQVTAMTALRKPFAHRDGSDGSLEAFTPGEGLVDSGARLKRPPAVIHPPDLSRRSNSRWPSPARKTCHSEPGLRSLARAQHLGR